MCHMQLLFLTLYIIIWEAYQLQAPSLCMAEKFSWKQKTHLFHSEQNLGDKKVGVMI